MKKTKLVSVAIAGLVLASMGGQVANAAVVENSDGTNAAGKTEVANGVNNTTTVEIIDNSDPTNPTDPLDPTDPDQKMLTLDKVPSLYDFESKLMKGKYTISSDEITGDPITVYNDRIDRAWSVKAVVEGNQLTNAATSDTFEVASFSINGKDIVTGTDGIVAKAVAEADRTGQTNTGNLETTVDSIGIEFNDSEGLLKVGDNLEGRIQYTLYNTIDAQ